MNIKASREYYLDHLKVGLTILVILHHLAIVFGGEGGFVITVSSNNLVISLLLTIFLAINQSYFMGLFFGISGYFSEKSLFKKGKESFVIGKIKRLLLPAMVYFFIVGPAIQVFVDLFYRSKSFDKLTYNPQFGAIWFIFVLSLFDIVFANLRGKFVKSYRSLSKSKIILLALIIGHITFLVRIIFPVGVFLLGIQMAHFPQYITAYLIGVSLARNHHELKIDLGEIKKALKLVLLLIVLLFVGLGIVVALIGDIGPAFGGFNFVSYIYSVWEQLMFFSMSYFLLALSKFYFNEKKKHSNFLSRNAYGAYLVHSAVIVGVVTILSKTELASFPLAFMSTLFSLLISFLLPQTYRLLLSRR